jgi:hypothetical protein
MEFEFDAPVFGVTLLPSAVQVNAESGMGI